MIERSAGARILRSVRLPFRTPAVLTFTACAVLTAAAQGPFLAPPVNLVVDGIPPIPLSLVEQVRPYTESRAARFPAWHPVRREMLIATRAGDTDQIHLVTDPLGPKTQLTFADEPVRIARFEPGGRFFIFNKDVGGNEFGQLYRFDMDGGRTTLLTDGGRSQNGGVLWSRKGDLIAYGSTRRNGTDRDVYLMNPADRGSDTLVMRGAGGGWSALDWSPGDTSLLVGEFKSFEKSNLYVLDLSTGMKTALTDPAEPGAYSSAAFSADGRGVYVTTDKGSEFQRLGYIDIGTKHFAPLTTDVKWDVEDFQISPDGTTIAFSTNEAGVSRLFLFDTASRRTRPVSGAPAGVLGSMTWHRNSRDLAFSLGSARSTSDVFSVDATTGAVTRWTESELGGVQASQLSEPELVRWKSFDGLEISGFYYRAPAKFAGKRPVIIDIHGGPEGQARPAFLGRENYLLHELGISIIAPNVRGSTGFGKTFMGLDNGMKREDSVRDIGALLDWVATRHELDARRVMVAGGSYGGYMALAASTHYGERIRAAVDVVGISNFNTFLKNTQDARRQLRRSEYGDERDPAMSAFFERIAPLHNAHKIAHPLLVVQGGNDPRVPRSEADQIVARVKQNGSPVWYLMARDEGHGFARKPNADFQFYATVMFVRRYLLGE